MEHPAREGAGSKPTLQAVQPWNLYARAEQIFVICLWHSHEHGRHHPLRISAGSCRIGLVAVDFPLALYVCLEREGSSLVSLFNLFSSLFLL